MMSRCLAFHRLQLAACVVGLLVANSGCDQKISGGAPPRAIPTVTVAEPVERELADFAEFTGRTEAVESVEVRARVSGYLNAIHFKAGSEVKAGDLLFEIDSRTYAAEVERNEGLLANAKAKIKRTEADLERQKTLREKGVNAQSELDLAIAEQGVAAAAIQTNEASLARAKLDMDFTKVTAPVAGRTSRERITVGNLVSSDTTMLTTIVSLDPIYAYFDIDERTMLEIQRLIREKKMKSAREQDVEVLLGLANETGFPHVGVIDLVDNRVSATTGTIQIRCRFPNADRVLTPGLFVRVQFQMGPTRTKLLVPEQALAQQQGQRYVYVVKPDNKVERRDVTVGRQDGSLRVIETGLQAGEKIIVQGHLRVRTGMEVKAEPYKVGVAAEAGSH